MIEGHRHFDGPGRKELIDDDDRDQGGEHYVCTYITEFAGRAVGKR